MEWIRGENKDFFKRTRGNSKGKIGRKSILYQNRRKKEKNYSHKVKR